jgi:2-hydroxy-6-oxonona-2,4-dienedioate hydrolase
MSQTATIASSCKSAVLLALLGATAVLGATPSRHPIPPSQTAPPVRFVAVYGQQMAYYDLGQGPTLVLVHGQGTSGAIDWSQVIHALAAHYRVIAIDNIGFGQSAKPNINYTTQTFVDFLAEFLREMQITHFNLAGESMGGGIATLYAIEAAQPGAALPQVDKLIVTDGAVPTPAWPATRPAQNQSATVAPARSNNTGRASATWRDLKANANAGFYHDPNYVTDEFAQDVWRMVISYQAAATVQALGETGAEAPGGSTAAIHNLFLEHLHDIKAPTLIVWGRDDRIIPVGNGAYLHAAISGSKLVVIPECGHGPALEQPEAWRDAVVAFIGN